MTRFVNELADITRRAMKWIATQTAKNPFTVDWDTENEPAPIAVLAKVNYGEDVIFLNVKKVNGTQVVGYDEYENEVEVPLGDLTPDGACHLADYISRQRK